VNRHSQVFTAPDGVSRTLLGPMVLTSHLVEKHKQSFMVHNFGDVPVEMTWQYSDDTGTTWKTIPNAVGMTSGSLASVSIPAKTERTVECAFPKGDRFRIIGQGVGGTTDGRIEMLEVDFESNLSDR
jgi:hypothetical protein